MHRVFTRRSRNTSNDSNKFNFKMRFNKIGGHLFSRLQNLSRAIVLPIAVLPIAGLLLGIGGGLASAFQNLNEVHKANIPNALINIFLIMKAAGNVVFANLGAIFAISIAFGFAKASKGVAALSGFITFAVMTAVIAGLFFPVTKDGKIFAGFDPWNLTGGKPFNDNSVKYSGFFASILGISNTFDTSVLGGILVGWLVSVIHNNSYNIKMPRVLAFFAGEKFVPILAVFLGIAMGIGFFFIWPVLLKGFQAIGHGMGEAMNFETESGKGELNGQNFKPTVAGAFIALFFGITERLLIPTGLHHVQYTPFWYTAIGGTWVNANGEIFNGAYSIFFAQFGSSGTGHFLQTPGTMFMSGRFAFMQYGYPFAALAMWMLAKPENKKTVAGILGSAALTSFLTGITEPMLFSFLFVAPLCFLLHAFLAGVSFMMAYLLNIVVGQGFAAGFIDFSFFGILPHALGKTTGFYWIFATGLIMAPAYFFGFYGIIKWRNYKTLGRESTVSESNLAFQGIKASLDKSTKHSNNKVLNLLNGLGGKSNIVDVDAKDQILFVTLNDTKLISKSLIRLSGTNSIKEKDQCLEITYLNGAKEVESQLHTELKNLVQNDSSKSVNIKSNRLETIFKGLGGKKNVVTLDNCATRLRVNVFDISKVDEELLRTTGAIAVVKKGKTVQVIYGLEVGNIKNDLLTIWKIS
ncbi:MAG: PTS transporter subunit EIIC [Spiroplasma sp.]